MSRKAKNKKLAEDRAAILWQRYRENNNRITVSEVFELTGRKASNLYASFQVQGVKVPPIWDTKSAIRERQIVALQDKAKELGRDWLTVNEAAEVLKILPKNVYGIKRRLKGSIPEIQHEKKTTPSLDVSGMERSWIGSPHTLKYYKAEPGPEPGQTTYYIL
jgi:hypothetical protein